MENPMKRTLPILGVVVFLSGCELGSYEDEDDLPTYRGQAVKQWIQELKGPNETKARRAQVNLNEMGPEDREVVPALIPLVDDQDKFVRITALKLLGQIGPNAKKAQQAIDNAILDKDREVVQAAIRASMRVSNTRE
jgi:hypothetical protein